MDQTVGRRMIRELIAHPQEFNQSGKSYELLQEYFKGLPITSLRPLLGSEDEQIQRAAIWIASEIGRDARCLLPVVIPLVSHVDRYVRYHALEVVMVSSFGEYVDSFMHIVLSLQSDDEVIRQLAMRLISNAEVSQLKAAARLFESSDSVGRNHHYGLSALLKGGLLGVTSVSTMINSEIPIIRKYGAIAAKRLVDRFPGLIEELQSSTDNDVLRFAKDVVE